MPSIGDKVKALRSARGWTLKELSDSTGISVSHLNAIEHATRPNPSFQYIARIAAAFEVPLTTFDQLGTDASGSAQNTSADLASRFLDLYDPDTRRFIVSESARPYVALAKQLAEQLDSDQQAPDPALILQLIAHFMRERKQTYKSV